MKFHDIFSRLLVRPQPHSLESERGYWLRIASENGLSFPKWLLDQGEKCPVGMTRCCVECLSSPQPLWRQEWEDPHTYWCAEHLTWLVDVCRSCMRPLRWSALRFLECSCGHDLRANPSSAVDHSLLTLVDTSVASVRELRLLGTFAIHGPSGKPGKKLHRMKMDDARAQLLAGAEVAAHWPESFLGELERHRVFTHAEGAAQLLREALPGIGRLSRLLPHGVWRQRVDAAIDDYCKASRNRSVPIVGRNALVRNRPPTLKAVATELGVRVESVAQMIDSGVAPIRGTRITSAGRRRRVVSAQDLPALRSMLDDKIEIKGAARLMALPASRVKELIAFGLLTQVDGHLSRSQVQLISESEQLMVVNSVSDLAGPVSVRVALRRWIKKTETSELILAIRNGAFQVHKASPTCPLGEWRISAACLSEWLMQHRDTDPAHLTLGEFSARLGLKGDTVRDLIRVGLLEVHPGIIRNRRCWCVSRQELERFVASYVPLSFLTTKANVRQRDGYVWATAQGHLVVTGPNVDGSRQYFVQRPVGEQDWPVAQSWNAHLITEGAAHYVRERLRFTARIRHTKIYESL